MEGALSMTEQTSNAPAPAAPDAGQVKTGDYTHTQLQQMATWEVERGALTREQADKLLAADGVKPAEQLAAMSPEAAEENRAYPPAQAADFDTSPLLTSGQE